MKTLLLLLSFFSFLSLAQAQRRASVSTSSHPTLTYDIGGSSGTYNDHGYTELNLGLNWFLTEHLVWRNAAFTRFGTQIDSASGLDTSARFVWNTPRDEQGFGIGVFAGPGYRISNTENSGVFGEAGVTLKAGGIALGVGVKSLSYNSPGTDSTGKTLPKNDTTIFLIIAGGGAL